MMIKEWKHLIKLQRIRTEQMHQSEMLMFMKYKDFVFIETNRILKTIFTKVYTEQLNKISQR